MSDEELTAGICCFYCGTEERPLFSRAGYTYCAACLRAQEQEYREEEQLRKRNAVREEL